MVRCVAPVDAEGRNPLHLASLEGATRCVELLLDVGGDTLLDLGDHNADTPLHLCARQGHHQIAQLLLQVRDNRDVLDTHTPGHAEHAEHPCHTAAPDSSDTDMVKLNTWLPFFPCSSSRLRYIFNNIVFRWILQLLISPFPSNLPSLFTSHPSSLDRG